MHFLQQSIFSTWRDWRREGVTRKCAHDGAGLCALCIRMHGSLIPLLHSTYGMLSAFLCPEGKFCHETSCQSRLSWGYDDGGVYGVVIYPNNILGCDFHCTSILSNISWRCLPTSPGVFRVPCEEAYCIGREFIVVPKTVPPSRLPPAAVPQSISCDCCAKCRSLGQSARNRFPEGGPQSRTVVLW